MKALFYLLILGFTPFAPLFGQSNQALEFLKAEIQRTARQRDEAQKKLLEVETLSADKIKFLSQEQLEIQERLNQSTREKLQLESNERIAQAAIKRTEADLAAREQALQELRQQQIQSRQEFERVTRDLSAKLAEAERAGSSQTAGPDEDLAAERERLRQEIQAREKKMLQAEAARQLDLQKLHQLQNDNDRLTADLENTQRREALANAKLAALESRLGNLQSELAQQYQERSELEQEQERLLGVIQNLNDRLKEVEANTVPKSQFDELSTSLEEALAENRQLKSELSRREQVPDLRKEFEDTQKQRDLLQAKEKTLLSKVENLEQDLVVANQDSRKLTIQNRRLQDQLKQEQKIREKMESEISDLETILKDAKAAGIQEKDLEDVALLVAEMEREKEAFRKEAITHRENVDLLRAELDNQNSKELVQIRDLQNMLSQQIEEITSNQKKIQKLETRAAHLEKVKIQKDQLVQMQTKSREDMRTLAKHIYELRSELVQSKETQRKAILAIQKNNELALELDRVRTEMDKIRRKNASIQNREFSNEEKMRELRIERDTDRARSKALEQEKRALLLEIQKLQKEISP
ncbi:hypothetical protein P0Y35_01560 [Kiritimatiellaeota bacterium B1221]|nr:hypothetical protein [Kiritimatiellaeota bacterium B1221]